jgi:glycosyltransferase involved in cell wall biosynthesis
VSVIITTCRRPRLVVRAVESVLRQTWSDLEVIVVIDGPDEATTEALASVYDERIRVCVRPERGGQAAAINCGVGLARGEWTALLDDDDHWFPEKLERQLCVAEASVLRNPVITCRFLARSESGEAVLPRRKPGPGEPVCEYLFCRTSLAFGEGILQTSTLLAPTRLLESVPMDESLAVHCDLDWLVRVGGRKDVGFEMPSGEEPLATWEMQQGRERLSHQRDWRYSFEWIRRTRERLTARAYAGFLLTWVSLTARQQRDWSAFFFLTKEVLFRGRPNLVECLVHLSIWSLPEDWRVNLSRNLATRSAGRLNPKKAYS